MNSYLCTSGRRYTVSAPDVDGLRWRVYLDEQPPPPAVADLERSREPLFKGKGKGKGKGRRT